jgi:hypothetical protein
MNAADPKITLLAWIHIDKAKPPKTTCLFTDGVSFWTGWYSTDDRCIYVNTGSGNIRLELHRVVWWAKLNNLVPILHP